MSSRDRARHYDQPAYVLHRYPFRESSLVVEAFTAEFGRIPLVARGARRPKSAMRGVLLAFQPLIMTWSGNTELRTLHKAEWHGPYVSLTGLSVICGFYVNELLLKLLPRDDPHERLFNAYAATVAELAAGGDQTPILRRFEKTLLRELGYALTLDRDAESGAPIAAERRYAYVVERGPVVLDGRGQETTVELAGQTLMDMEADRYTSAETLQQSKALLRMLINHYLSGQVLHTRTLLRDLMQL